MVVEVEYRSEGYKRYRPLGHQPDAWALASDPSIAKRNCATIASSGTRRLGDPTALFALHLMRINADKPISSMVWQAGPRESSRLAVRSSRVVERTVTGAAARFIDGAVEQAASPNSVDRVKREGLSRMKGISIRNFNSHKATTEEDREPPHWHYRTLSCKKL